MVFNGARFDREDADTFVQRHIKSEHCDPLPWSEQLDLLRKYKQNGDKKALSKLVQSHQRTIIKQVAKFLKRGLDKSDLIQEANLGLLKAIHKFDEDRGAKLNTWAVWWIRDALQTAVRYRSNTCSKTNMNPTAQLIQKEWNQIRINEGRYASAKEIAEITGLSEERVAENRQYMYQVISLDEVSNPSMEKISRLESLADETSMSVESQVERAMILSELNHLLSHLSPADLDFVRRKFGLYDGHVRTRSEAAEMYQMEDSEMARWEHDILDYLRSIKNSRGDRGNGDHSDGKGC